MTARMPNSFVARPDKLSGVDQSGLGPAATGYIGGNREQSDRQRHYRYHDFRPIDVEQFFA